MSLFKKGGVNDLRRIFPGGDSQGCGDERLVWDSIAQEPARLAGTPIKFYVIRRAKNRDPLYKEPSRGKEWSFEGPFELWGTVDFDESNDVDPEATEMGLLVSSDAVVWIARKEFEDREAPYPKIGDVLAFWDAPPFGREEEETQWDVVRAERDGSVFTSAAYTMFKINVKRRDKFLAFRKTEEE